MLGYLYYTSISTGIILYIWAPRFDIWTSLKTTKKAWLSLKKGSDLIKIRIIIKYYITVTHFYLTILTNFSFTYRTESRHPGSFLKKKTVYLRTQTKKIQIQNKMQKQPKSWRFECFGSFLLSPSSSFFFVFVSLCLDGCCSWKTTLRGD